MLETYALSAVALGALALSLPLAKRRLELSQAKHPSLTGHARMARRVASWLPGYRYDEEHFFASDGAPESVVAQRRAALARLAQLYQQRYARSLALSAEAAEGLPDLQFTGSYRVPFQYSALLRQHLKVASFMQSAEGVTLTDLDGNVFHDLTGSYGVNLFGVDFYKACIAEGSALVQSLGPVLGSYHPVVARNVERLKAISGLDAVSFHMSGTEAVMQAVRLARYHTRRTHLVRFCGAYHGWWDDVQPGPGNPAMPQHTYTLREMHDDTLRVLRKRRDIACVLVNPLQALHPNAGAPGDSVAGRQLAPCALRPRRLCRLAAPAAPGVQRARHRADLRRGLRRLPPGAGRRAGLLRRARRPGDLRQDPRRRPAGGRGLRAARPDEALSRRAAGRHLLRPRHLQLAPLCDGGDERLPRPPANAPRCRPCTTGSTSAGTGAR